MKEVEFLKEKNIKITRGRLIIIKIFEKCKDAVNADFIYDECLKEGININLSTIYRNLEMMVKKDILEKFDVGNGKYDYVLKITSHKHILQCESCHRKIEIDCPMQPIEEMIKMRTGFTLIDHELKLKCLCDECINKGKNKS